MARCSVQGNNCCSIRKDFIFCPKKKSAFDTKKVQLLLSCLGSIDFSDYASFKISMEMTEKKKFFSEKQKWK